MASGLTPTYLLPYPLQTDSVNVASDVEDLAIAVETELLLKAPLASPTFTGTPVAPTAASDTNTTQIATTQFVINQGYLKSSTASSTYATLASPTLTGTPTAPTAALGTNTTQIATTAYVQNELDSFVTLPNQTGANGFFLTSNGSSASWKQIQTTDVSGLSTVINGLANTYSPLNITISTSTAVQRVLSEGDTATMIQMNNASGNTLQIPLDGANGYTFPVGAQVVVVQAGAGQTNVTGASGVTVRATPGLKLRAQWSAATLVKTAANTWIVFGDVIA